MILVVFASRSNRHVYGRVAARLREKQADFELRICSAHKTPGELTNILEKKCSVIIAGAGMAAHLAGAIAARTTTPVIGVPCSDNFGGMDALLSTVQMPPGIPVLCTGVDMAEDAADAAVAISGGFKRVSVLAKPGYAEKCADYLFRLKVPYELSYVLQEAINIRFVDLGKAGSASVLSEGKFIINCPVAESTSCRDALKLAKIKSGLWVSLNRYDNAAIAAAEILGKERELAENREEFAAAVSRADSDENAKQ